MRGRLKRPCTTADAIYWWLAELMPFEALFIAQKVENWQQRTFLAPRELGIGRTGEEWGGPVMWVCFVDQHQSSVGAGNPYLK